MKSDKGRLVKGEEVTVRVDDIDLPLSCFWVKDRPPFCGKIAKGVIFLVPVYNSSDHIKTWFKMVERLDPMPEKVIFCENNSTDDTLKLISEWKFPHEIIRIELVPNASRVIDNRYGAIAIVRELLLTRARYLNPKFAIFIDDDIFPESCNFIELITKSEKDIVGGVYMRPLQEGHSFEVEWVIDTRWSVDQPIEQMPKFAETLEEEKQKVREWTTEGNFALSFVNVEKNKLYEVESTGTGCMCLSSKVVQDRKLCFYPMWGKESEDFGFCLSAGTIGYQIFLDSSVKCAHTICPTKQRLWD